MLPGDVVITYRLFARQSELNLVDLQLLLEVFFLTLLNVNLLAHMVLQRDLSLSGVIRNLLFLLLVMVLYQDSDVVLALIQLGQIFVLFECLVE